MYRGLVAFLLSEVADQKVYVQISDLPLDYSERRDVRVGRRERVS
jgi:hypothetical protein